ncbi:putative Nudix hydrolase P35G2.12 [Curvularia clavata]|uniref:Nudix hydrolase P35G2.12 n=1 Tax=Curvularia clavata TaxID=95742 RepID=A0A9Q8Z7V2_CURCL|nr:putative Nudix hydrolase P35G2.12 [Curvularia clavata]
MASENTNTPKVTSLTDLSSSDAKWIKLQKATYTDARGTSRVWEIASRKTTGSSGIDAVAMGNIIYHPSKPPSTIVVIQFRPPVNAFTIEWPAGLIDAHETPQEAAVRELYEETGYKGKVVSTSPAVAADPGMTSANMCLCMVEIHLNEGDPEPEQHLDEGEDIQRVNIPVADLYDRLEEFAKEGYVVAAKLYHWAAGARTVCGYSIKFGLQATEYVTCKVEFTGPGKDDWLVAAHTALGISTADTVSARPQSYITL